MPLTNQQRAHFERRLLEERARAAEILTGLDRRLRTSAQASAGDLSHVPLHPADAGTDESERELDASQETRVGRQMSEIEAALERLYQTPELFGRDEISGDDIPLARLQLVPWARTRADDDVSSRTRSRRP